MKADVYKVTLMVIDFEGLGKDNLVSLLEQSRYFSPSVRDCQETSVVWDDDHPLNQKGWEAAFDEMFSSLQRTKEPA